MNEAGKLTNLNDLVEGAYVLCDNKKYGYVTSVTGQITDLHGGIGQCRASITYPGYGSSFHTYRHDGRSREEAGYDIVKIVRPEDAKVKQTKIISDKPLNPDLLKKVYLALDMCVCAAELGTSKLKGENRDFDGVKLKVWLSKNYNITIKVL